MQQLAIGRECDVLGLHLGVDVTRLRSLLRSAPLACATRRLSANSSSSLSPNRFLQWLRRSVRAETHAGKTPRRSRMKIGDVDQALTQAFIGQVVNGLEQQQPIANRVGIPGCPLSL
jgi:hypothetical protein